MALLHVLYGSEWHYIKGYKKDNKWYNVATNELIRNDYIYNIEDD